MQYAIIKASGKQYRVMVGDTLEVDHLAGEVSKTIDFPEVLLFVDGDKVVVGKPSINGAKVSATLVENKKGDKIRVTRFKAKSRYRKVTGFRANLSVIKIDKIELGKESKSEKIEESTKTASVESKK